MLLQYRLLNVEYCLLQLDVEGAELEILEGMTEDCWARVDQVIYCVDTPDHWFSH